MTRAVVEDVSVVLVVVVTCSVNDSVVFIISVVSLKSGIGAVSSFLSLDSSLLSTTMSLGTLLVCSSSTSFSISSTVSSGKGALKQLSSISTKFSIPP